MQDIMTLASSRCKTARLYAVGDFNVDQLPSLAADPWPGPDRLQHHSERRSLLLSLAEHLGVHCQIPDCGLNFDFGNLPPNLIELTPEGLPVPPVSRVPTEHQQGLPSLLDYALVDDRESTRSDLIWLDHHSDHACLVLSLDLVPGKRPVRQKKIWRVRSEAQALEDVHRRMLYTDLTPTIDNLLQITQQMMEQHSSNRVSAARACLVREPLECKEKVQEIRQAHTTTEQRRLCRQLQVLREKHLLQRREEQDADTFKKGRPKWKAKKLFPVTFLNSPEHGKTYNEAEIAKATEVFFSKLWQSDEPAHPQQIQDYLASREGAGLKFDFGTLGLHIRAINNPDRIDAWGVCARALDIVFRAAPQFFLDTLNHACSTSSAFSSMKFSGYTKAKSRGCIPPEKIRSIIPLPCLVQIVDMELAYHINGICDYIANGLGVGFCDCAVSGRQLLDMSFSAKLAIEKGLDVHSKLSIAQADVEKFYDNLDCLRAAAFLEDFVGEQAGDITPIDFESNTLGAVCATLVRLHMLPCISLSIGEEMACMQSRTRGMHTGSRSAAAAGRVPMLHLACERMPYWRQESRL